MKKLIRDWSMTVLVLVVLFGASSMATASPMVSVGSTTLFYDDFEHPVVTDPVHPPEPNSAAVGTWSGTNSLTHIETATSQFTDASGTSPANAPTAAFQGNQFLRLQRPTSSSQLAGDFGNVATPGTGSTTVSATFAMYIPDSTANFTASFGLSTDFAENFVPVYIYVHSSVDGYDISYSNSVSQVTILKPDSTPLTYLPNTWQIWQLNYTLAAGNHNDTYTVSIDGVSSAATSQVYLNDGTFDNGSTALRYLMFQALGNNTAFFVDAAPEPASLGLLAVGSLTLLRRRR